MRTIQAWGLMMLVMVSAAFGQTASDLGEGLRAELTNTPGVTAIKWWGKAGRTYFVQSSETLLPDSWQYMPVVEAGADAVCTWNLQTSASKMFVRLVFTDQAFSGSAADADFDGDGLTNGQEVAVGGPGTDPVGTDTDGDGAPDGAEYRQGSNPRDSALKPMAGEPEQYNYAPTLILGRQTRHLTNSWGKSKDAQNQTVEWGSLSWQTPGLSNHSLNYNDFAERYTAKLSEPVMDWLASGFGEPTTSYAIGSCLWRYSSQNNGDTQSHYVSVNDARIVLRTYHSGTAAQWEIPRTVMRYVHEGSEKPPYAYNYTNVELATMTVGPLASMSQPMDLMPRPSQDRGTTEGAGLIGISSFAGLSLDAETSNTIVPKLEPWFMLPVGETRTVTVSNGVANDDTVYQLSGGGLPGSILTGGSISLSSTATDDITGVLRVGYRPAGGTAVFAQEPLLNIAVYTRRVLDINIIPVAYVAASGTVVPPAHLPTEAAAKSYLDSVYLPQANIECRVTIKPVQQIEWDNRGGWENSNGSIFGAGDGCFTFVDTTVVPLSVPRGDLSTLEETELMEQLMYHRTPSVIANPTTTLNVLWIVAPKGLYHIDWAREEDQPDFTEATYADVVGYCMKGPKWFGQYVYVLDRAPHPLEPQATVLYTLAHEIGHALGLDHCTEQRTQAYSRFSENEHRLMTGRYGPKRGTGPKKMVHWEWDRVRQSSFAKTPGNS
ncbi:MAG: hypothetical protein JNN17_23300 [Verrucomicrobiaceae bacterium]|nr:hypothetical protein [Verrucomicrobiaceae bacterium]